MTMSATASIENTHLREQVTPSKQSNLRSVLATYLLEHKIASQGLSEYMC